MTKSERMTNPNAQRTAAFPSVSRASGSGLPLDSEGFIDEFQQIPISLNGSELRKLLPDVVRRAEQKANVCLSKHRSVVVGVACGDDVVIQVPQRRDGLSLLVAEAQP